MITIALFALAAGVAALARAEVGRRWNRPDGMPYGILAVNIVGSLLLGLMWNINPPTLTVVGVGGLGTFTTFSSFARDIVALAQRRQAVAAGAYLTLSLVGGILAASAGVAIVT
jgi:fluoride exporter